MRNSGMQSYSTYLLFKQVDDKLIAFHKSSNTLCTYDLNRLKIISQHKCKDNLTEYTRAHPNQKDCVLIKNDKEETNTGFEWLYDQTNSLKPLKN